MNEYDSAVMQVFTLAFSLGVVVGAAFVGLALGHPQARGDVDRDEPEA